jgi:hypothetical protein
MIRYFDLGPELRLSDIVFAGSHDASITGGDVNAKTQDLDIGGQARAGVRLFDLRILAHGGKEGASLVGYHGKGAGPEKLKMVSDHSGRSYDLKVSKSMSYGTVGEKLSTMLHQAKHFVDNSNEFLIFKFDKCKNYPLIADYCVSILGSSIYKPIGIELGKCTLDDLKGKVICVFNEKGLAEIKHLGTSNGMLGFRNLNSKEDPKPYLANYPGLQYFGKGGTSAMAFWRSKSDKIDENYEKQKKLMLKMANAKIPTAPDVLGMMYWTTTGLKESIKERDAVMWGTTGVRRMEELWNSALKKAIETQLEQDRMKCMEYGGKRRMKAFFPNIVMIDFADADKCQTIYDLNHVLENKLIEAYDKSVKKGVVWA